MEGQVWKVVGGGASGGVVVRAGRGIASPELPVRLATGSLVRQVAQERGRLQYELLTGDGPPGGWVTVKVGSRELLARASAEEAGPHQRREAADASRQRVAAAEGQWHKVLGVAASASVEEVRRAFRELALLHHPDKSGAEEGDGGETFKLVQSAYEQGLLEASTSESRVQLPAPSPEEALCPVPINAPRPRLRAACDDFEAKVDLGVSKSVPDDVPYVDVEQLAEWFLEGSCVTIDAREPSEMLGINAVMLPGAVSLGYTRLLKSPETLQPELARLKTHADGGRRLVSYSTFGSPSNGNHAIVCCLLVDVFGFDVEQMACLEDGYLVWRRWSESHRDTLEKIRAKYAGL